MNSLNIDLELLIYSYLQLEEILTIFSQNLIVRDKIIKIYYKKLPNLDKASKDGNLETIKYLLEQVSINKKNYRSKIDDIINICCRFGHLKIIEYFCKNHHPSLSTEINFACAYGYLEIVMYLFARGVKPTSYAIEYASQNGYLEMVKYLVKNGVEPTISALKSAKMGKHPLIVEYLESVI